MCVTNTKPGVKPVKLFDERGLFMIVTPNGGKWWRFKYRFDNKEKLLYLGVYPDVGLKDARERRDAARKLVAAGIDPGVNRKAQKAARQESAANSFEVVAREWYVKRAPTWAANHGGRILSRFERDIFPWVGGRPIGELTAPELLDVVRRIERRGALETAHRALGNCGRYSGTPSRPVAHCAIRPPICVAPSPDEADCCPGDQTRLHEGVTQVAQRRAVSRPKVAVQST